jgi:trk system potassium uptake protein TrkH
VIDLRPVLFVVGLFLVILAVGMCLPLIADLATGEPDWAVFAASAAITLFVGGSLSLAYRPIGRFDLTTRDAFLLTTLVWIGAAAFGALPLAFSRLDLSYTDAVFEAMSGLTTTGSTVIVGLDDASAGVLLWRGVLQWMGGIGIVVMAAAILPFLRIGGMQLFRTESSDRSDKIVASVTQLSIAIVVLYTGFTVVCAFMLMGVGMSAFDAAIHAAAAVSTGGFSTKDASVGFYDSAAIELILVLFMVLGGATATLFLQIPGGRFRQLWTDSQMRWYLGMLVVATLVVAGWQWWVNARPLLQALRESCFNVVSVVTTTGFASADYTTWGALPNVMFFFLTFVGGCTGSTSGAVKLFRLMVFGAVIRAQFIRLIHPRAAMQPSYDGRPIDEGVLSSVLTFVMLYGVTFAVLACGLGLTGLDLVTSLSGAATALGNVGPGLGEIIGPAGNFSTLPDAAKWMLTAGMLLGRLELLTIFVILTPAFWRS